MLDSGCFLGVSVGANAVGEKLFNQVIIANVVSAIKNAELLIDGINQANSTSAKMQFSHLVSRPWNRCFLRCIL